MFFLDFLQRLSHEPLCKSGESREARRDSRYEQTVRFAKVPNLFFPLFVCLVLFCMASDFSHFSDKNALSYRAVGGLYSLRLNHKMPVLPAE